jgi:hypothetical protein
MEIEVLFQSQGFTFYGIMNNGKSLVKEFLEGLDEENRTQMMALFRLILEQGQVPHNDLRFRKLGDKIYELKTRKGARILCFWGRHQNSLVLTHGFSKCKQRRLKAERQRAALWFQEYSNSFRK